MAVLRLRAKAVQRLSWFLLEALCNVSSSEYRPGTCRKLRSGQRINIYLEGSSISELATVQCKCSLRRDTSRTSSSSCSAAPIRGQGRKLLPVSLRFYDRIASLTDHRVSPKRFRSLRLWSEPRCVPTSKFAIFTKEKGDEGCQWSKERSCMPVT